MFKVGDIVLVRDSGGVGRVTDIGTRFVSRGAYETIYLVGTTWYGWEHLATTQPQKYRVVLETENPDQFKMLNGSTFVSSEVIR